jgi:hypothetical protein
VNVRLLGDYYQVSLDRREVYAFVKRWPCCRVKVKPSVFTFSARNGDLVGSNNVGDGAEFVALAAAAQDAGQCALRNGLTVSWGKGETL